MLLVLGPHRSGTSLTARMLECLGAVNSPRLNPPNEHNPKGYFEDLDIYEFNERVLLPALGTSWKALAPVEWCRLSAPARAGLHGQALDLIRRNYRGEAPVRILKEPRICRLLPFWLPVLEEAGFDVDLVMVVRDPSEVASSLARRDGFAPARGAMLHLACWLDLLRDAGGRPAAFVFFPDIFRSPEECLRGVAGRLGLPLPADFADRVEEFRTRHLDGALRHNRGGCRDAAPPEELPGLVTAFHEKLQQGRHAPDLAALRAAAGSAAATLASLAPLLNLLDETGAADDDADRSDEGSSPPSPTGELRAYAKRADVALAQAGRMAAKLVELQASHQTMAAAESVRMARLRQSLARCEEQLVGMVRSTSWRISAPVRWLKMLADLAVRPERRAITWHVLRHHRGSGMFDADWYRRQNPEVRETAARPFIHFALHGVHAGLAPNPYFDAAYYAAAGGARIPAGRPPLADFVLSGFRENRPCCPLFDPEFYARNNPDVDPGRHNLLAHYVRHGWREGRNPHPLFDVRFFEENRPARDGEPLEPLARYLRGGWQDGADPHPFFEVRYYLRENPQVASSGAEPLAHFHRTGAFEGRHPFEDFNCGLMLSRHPHLAAQRINPLDYYLHHDWAADPFPEFTLALSLEGVRPGQSAARAAVRRRFLPARAAATLPAEALPTGQLGPPPRTRPDIRAIAIYLPQFHRISENDKWWGRGFTEWTNVRRGAPQYMGHDQPHVPHPDLGYYDLNDPAVLERQAAMARAAGIEGFCFYYYWFDGKRLLEMPLDRLLATGRPDFPFCLCWANENWTRRWDGREREVLMSQNHGPGSDERFIRDVLPALRDPRYIRIDGRPLLAVYRPGQLPDPAGTARRWREVCRAEGLGEIFLACMDGLDAPAPNAIGFDTAIQFPPIKAQATRIDHLLALRRPETFAGHVFDYRHMVVNYAFDARRRAAWPAVCPSWDNTARMQERAHSWINATPHNYRLWLARVAEDLRADTPEQRRVLFINAWNEWAEGNHLEPDRRHGYAFLHATRQVLTRDPGAGRLRILAIGHDAFGAGAQRVLLCLLRELRRADAAETRLLLRSGAGALLPEFEMAAPTSVLDGPAPRDEVLRAALAWRPDVILSNTVTNGPLLAELAALAGEPIPVVTHVHEMQAAIERWAPGAVMEQTLSCSSHFIAASAPVRENLMANHGVPVERISLIHEFIESRGEETPDARSVAAKRAELAWPKDAFVVAGCGTIDLRKGFDLFVSTARQVVRADPRAIFAWIGAPAHETATLQEEIAAAGPAGGILLAGERPDAAECLAAADVLFLPSREDPFPLVVLEAADAGVPAVAFAGTGGIPEFIGNDAGLVVPAGDTGAAAEAILGLARDPERRRRLGERAREKVRGAHTAPHAVAKIRGLLGQVAGETGGLTPAVLPAAGCAGRPRATRTKGRPLVTVIVPNYNHAPFLGERLESIAAQDLDDMEIILLDDASRDSSVQILNDFCRRDRRARLLAGRANSGSTFRQWRRGLLEARGEFVWIAESDDSAEPFLLQSLLRIHEENPQLALCYSQSMMVDVAGRPLGSAASHTADLSAERWSHDYIASGPDELEVALSRRNTIPNASAVLLRNSPALAGMVDESLRLCADWLLYVRLCGCGGVGYHHAPLNRWRLGSSGARTKPPGETEWHESGPIFDEIGRILGWPEEEKLRRHRIFQHECDDWRGRP
jgi:glycosyltransferase involved in cell wall biosynthesis